MHAFEASARFAGPAFVSSVWQGAVLAAAVWLCLRVAPRATASLRFALWTGVLAVVALLPLLESGFVSQAGTALSGPVLRVDPRWSLGLAAVWFALSMLRVGSLAAHSFHLWTLHREAEPVALTGKIDQLLRGCGRRVEVRTSDQLERPGVIGFFQPRILIPSWLYPRLTAAELEQIVLHELEHLHRGDDWLNLLQKLSLVLFPLNPVLIGIERLLCRERELACDDGVLNRTGAPRAYASCLASLAERGLDHRGLSLALGALERRSELSRRVYRILRARVVLPPAQARLLTAGVGLVLLGGAVGLARCPQLVSFVAPIQPAMAAARPVPLPFHQGQPFLYSDAEASSAGLVKASFAAAPTVHKTSARKKHKAVRAPFTKESGLEPPAKHDGLLLRTGWTGAESAKLVTLGEDLPFAGTFAAVRVDGGWLLVQL